MTRWTSRGVPAALATALWVAGCGGATETPAEAALPAFDAAGMVAGVDHPFMPLAPGSRWRYEAASDEGTEVVEIVVLAETREVMGVPCTVVRDTVTVGGVIVEDTYDWFAQDGDGNVWYFGEEVANYENGVLADHDGSWEAGVDGALPGIVMYADPATHVGETFRQEYYAGEAEDMAKVLSTTEQITVPFGSFENVVQTEDWTPLEPGLREQKYYAPGVGVIKEVNLTTGNDIVLLEMTTP